MFCARITQSSAASICGSRDHMGNMWMEINPVGKRKRNLDRDQRLASFHSFLPLFTIPSKFGILWDFFLFSKEKSELKSDLRFFSLSLPTLFHSWPCHSLKTKFCPRKNSTILKVSRLRLIRVPLDLQEPFHLCLSLKPFSFFSDLVNLQWGKDSEPSL